AQNWDRFLTGGDRGAFQADSGLGEGPSSARSRVAVTPAPQQRNRAFRKVVAHPARSGVVHHLALAPDAVLLAEGGRRLGHALAAAVFLVHHPFQRRPTRRRNLVGRHPTRLAASHPVLQRERMGHRAFQHSRPQAFAVRQFTDHHCLLQVGRDGHHRAGFRQAAQHAHSLALKRLFVADFGRVGAVRTPGVD
ncbi:MAG: hypothetical protein EON48_03585, partial [Acetobacteraceae bacterium]